MQGDWQIWPDRTCLQLIPKKKKNVLKLFGSFGLLNYYYVSGPTDGRWLCSLNQYTFTDSLVDEQIHVSHDETLIMFYESINQYIFSDFLVDLWLNKYIYISSHACDSCDRRHIYIYILERFIQILCKGDGL